MLSSKVARNILKEVKFPDDVDPTYEYSTSRKIRKQSVSAGEEYCNIAAAIQIQRFWRGHRTRCKLQDIFRKHKYKGSISADLNYDSSGKKKSLGHLYPMVKARYRDYLKWCRDQDIKLDSSAVLSFEDYCARIIQSWWRGQDEQNSKTSVRRTSRVIDLGECSVHLPLDSVSAAIIIQRAWRKFNNTRVFRFYRDLINFRGRGDSKLMLRCINPVEATLLDKATGAHVKFRLGGDKFPPSIYYKVFTHRPIVDLCAYSPRDYTAMAYRQKLPQDLHNNQRRENTPSVNDKENWYKRHENNGWRIVSNRFFLTKFQDPITRETSSKQYDFHYSKVQRRETQAKKRKQKKIEWLQKMHREGMLQAHKDLTAATTSAIHIAADQLVELSETHGHEAVEDEDIDDLLSWTNALNFDEYFEDWQLSASTSRAYSDYHNQSEDDPYQLSLMRQPK